MTKRKKRTICWIVFIALAYFVSRPMYYPGVGNNPNTREESIRLLQKGKFPFSIQMKTIYPTILRRRILA